MSDTETGDSGPGTARPCLRQQETGGTPEEAAPPTVVLASLPAQWRAEAKSSGAAYGNALRDCARELEGVLSVSPRGCWEHPGVMGYQHPECGFCWHGKDGLDVPVTGRGANREPVCPRCQPQLPADQVSVSREDLQALVGFAQGVGQKTSEQRALVDRLSAAAEVTG